MKLMVLSSVMQQFDKVDLVAASQRKHALVFQMVGHGIAKLGSKMGGK